MRQIRNGVFETNSSSTHSIAIPKKNVSMDKLPKKLAFRVGEFGWGCERVSPCEYLYTAIMETPDPFVYLSKISDVLERLGVGFSFGKVEFGKYGLRNGGIDHGLESSVVEEIVMNEGRLIRYLFGDTCVFTGNDNCDCPDRYGKCSCAEFKN